MLSFFLSPTVRFRSERRTIVVSIDRLLNYLLYCSTCEFSHACFASKFRVPNKSKLCREQRKLDNLVSNLEKAQANFKATCLLCHGICSGLFYDPPFICKRIHYIPKFDNGNTPLVADHNSTSSIYKYFSEA